MYYSGALSCARQAALEIQDLSCTYLAYHELESVFVVVIIFTLSWASLHVQTLPAKGPQHAGRGQALMAAIKHPELPQASAATAASNAAGLCKSIAGIATDVNTSSH